jgi:hypothetical protein
LQLFHKFRSNIVRNGEKIAKLPAKFPASRESLDVLSNSGRFERHRDGKPRALAATISRSIPMKYLLMIYGNEAAIKAASKADNDQMLAAYGAYIEAMTKAGVMVGRNRLQLSTSATTVRVTNGKTQVLDGPYAETKEQLGGYLLIDVPDLDTALSWAARCPGASHGVMEVRPIWEM